MSLPFFIFPMPYQDNSSLPPAVKKLSAKLQTAFRKAFNAAYKKYQKEETAFKVAWSQVRKMQGGKSLNFDPREKLLDTLGNIEVYLVDGEVVREQEGGQEFTNYASHPALDIVPPDEIWIDNDANESELPSLIEAAETQYKLMTQGKSYDEALAMADKRQRAVAEETPRGTSEPVTEPHIEKLEITNDGVTVWLVSGEYVREHLYADFVEGGHDKVYKFIPENEIWLDDSISNQERPYILLHEKYERELMANGMDYLEAHAKASRKEYEMRQALWEADETDVTRVGAKSAKDGIMEKILIWDDEIKAAGDKGYGGFLVVDDKGKHLPTKKNGKISRSLAAAAWAALFSAGGHRGKKYEGSNKNEAKKKLRALYKRMGWTPPSEKAVPPEFFDDTEGGDPISDLELAQLWSESNLRAITDAPKLRAKDSQYCANCNFYKWFPNMRCYDEPMAERNLTPEDVEEIVEHQQMMRGICEEPSIEAEVGANWVCDKWEAYNWKDHMPDDAEEVDEEKALQLKAMSVDTENTVKKLVPIKMMGETRFGGYSVYFAREPKKEKDAVGTAFLRSTDFGEVYDHVPILYHHGLTKAFDNDKIAKTVKAQIDDVGIWLEGELDRSKKYWTKVKANIEKGIYYFSGGTAEHLIRYGEDGVLKSFPIIEWSITTTPAEWRLGAAQFYKSIGIDLDSGAASQADDKGKGEENSRQSQKRESEKRDARNESADKNKSEIKMEMTQEQFDAQVQAKIAQAIKAQKDEDAKIAQEAEAKRQAEVAKQAEIKAEVEKQVAAIKAALPADETQRPGYGRYNIARRPLGDGFSISKAIRSIAMQSDGKPNAWSGAERELKAMTTYMNEVRASLAEGVGNLGGYLVPPEYMQDQFIPLLRARAVVRGAGPVVYPTKSDIVYIPSQTGGATAAWYGENSTLSASNLTVGQLAINVRKIGALEYISNELLADASPAADTIVREDLVRVVANLEDQTFLLSNGAAPNFANAPLGYVNYPGVSQYTLAGDVGNGATIQARDIFGFKLKMMQANVPADGWAWFMSPRSWDEIAQLKDAQNRYLLETLTGGNISQYPAYGTYPEGPEDSVKGSVQGRLLGYPVYVTNNISETNTKGNNTDCSYIILARMADTIIVERAGLELMATNVAGTAFASDQTWVRAILREGFGIRHAAGVTYADGVR